jgi:hypothetical protein
MKAEALSDRGVVVPGGTGRCATAYEKVRERASGARVDFVQADATLPRRDQAALFLAGAQSRRITGQAIGVNGEISVG